MVIVNYKSKRKLKKAVGESLKATINGKSGELIHNGEPFFVTNQNKSFRATITMVNGVIREVR